MAAISWFANSASMVMQSGSSFATVAAIRNIRVTPHFEVAELYGMESLLRAGAARHTFSVDVAIEYAMWDATADTVMGAFLYGAATTGSSFTVNDAGCRSRTATFHIYATVQDTACASQMSLTVTDVYFNEIPVELRENEFISRNMTGKGKNFTIAYTSV